MSEHLPREGEVVVKGLSGRKFGFKFRSARTGEPARFDESHIGILLMILLRAHRNDPELGDNLHLLGYAIEWEDEVREPTP